MVYIYIYTHTQNLTLQEKMIMKKLHMNSLNLLQSQKVLTQKRNKHIDELIMVMMREKFNFTEEKK